MLRRGGRLLLVVAWAAHAQDDGGDDEDHVERIRRLLVPVKAAPDVDLPVRPTASWDDTVRLRLAGESEVLRMIAPGQVLELTIEGTGAADDTGRVWGRARHWDGTHVESGSWAVELRQGDEIEGWICTSRRFDVERRVKSPARGVTVELLSVGEHRDRAHVVACGAAIGLWELGRPEPARTRLTQRVQVVLREWAAVDVPPQQVPVHFRPASTLDHRVLRDVVRALSDAGVTGLTLTSRP